MGSHSQHFSPWRLRATINTNKITASKVTIKEVISVYMPTKTDPRINKIFCQSLGIDALPVSHSRR